MSIGNAGISMVPPNAFTRAGIVNVKDFGAVGDGTTDDTTAFSSFTAAVGANGTGIIPAGTYSLTSVPTFATSAQYLFDPGAVLLLNGVPQRRMSYYIAADGWLNAIRDTFASGSDATTTGTISAGSKSLTVADVTGRAIGQGIVVGQAGPAATCAAPTVNTPTFTGAAGSTTYGYQLVAFDKNGGCSAPSTVQTVGNCSSYLDTADYVSLAWSVDSNTEGVIVFETTVGRGFLGVFPANVSEIRDFGLPGTDFSGSLPFWMPSSLPATQQNQYLATQVVGIADTTFTLADAAASAVNSGIVWHDDAAELNALAGSGQRVDFLKGTYLSTQPITNTNGTTVIWHGEAPSVDLNGVVSDGVIFDYQGGMVADLLTIAPGSTSSQIAGCELDGLAVRGRSVARDAFSLNRCVLSRFINLHGEYMGRATMRTHCDESTASYYGNFESNKIDMVNGSRQPMTLILDGLLGTGFVVDTTDCEISNIYGWVLVPSVAPFYSDTGYRANPTSGVLWLKMEDNNTITNVVGGLAVAAYNGGASVAPPGIYLDGSGGYSNIRHIKVTQGIWATDLAPAGEFPGGPLHITDYDLSNAESVPVGTSSGLPRILWTSTEDIATAEGVAVTSTSQQNILTMTVPVTGLYMISGYVRINNGTSGNDISFGCLYTDPDGTAVPINFDLTPNSGAISTFANGSNAFDNGWWSANTRTFYAKGGTAITITYTDPTNTPNDTVSAYSKRVTL